MCVSAAVVGGSVREQSGLPVISLLRRWSAGSLNKTPCDFCGSDPLAISPCDRTLPSFPLEARFGYDVVGVYTFRCLALLPRPDRALL